MTLAIIIVTVLLVLGLGLLILWLMRKSQRVVPAATERQDARRDRVVAVDDDGRPVRASQEGDEAAPPDEAAFEAALKEELDELRD
jgi:flagellar basal body-associated protein FliL